MWPAREVGIDQGTGIHTLYDLHTCRPLSNSLYECQRSPWSNVELTHIDDLVANCDRKYSNVLN